MGRARAAAARLSRTGPVRRFRTATEVLVTPRVRGDLGSHQAHLAHVDNRLGAVDPVLHDLSSRLADVETHLPRLLNAITSSDGAARLAQRRLDDLAGALEESSKSLAATAAALNELESAVAGHASTQRWLIERTEMVRAEVLHEIRYGAEGGGVATDASVGRTELVGGDDPVEMIEPYDGELRLNLGCGHLPVEGYVNVDARPLPGVDVVAPVGRLPVVPGTVTEIFSSHLLEHFPQEHLRRTLLPYWASLLAPAGMFRAVVPDLDAMMRAYADGEMDFATVREVTYGGQEYEGDTHFTGFTVAHLTELLEEAGLVEVDVMARARRSGDCYELELTAARPD